MADISQDTIFKGILVTCKLTDLRSFPAWFRQYRVTAQTLGIWEVVNPDEPPNPEDHKSWVTFQAFKKDWNTKTEHLDGLDEELTKEKLERYQASIPSYQVQTAVEIKDADSLDEKRVKIAYNHFLRKLVKQDFTSNQGMALFNWVIKSVDDTLLTAAHNDIYEGEVASVRLIVQKLRHLINPSITAELTAIRERYRAALTKARKGSVKPSAWWAEWYTAYREALAQKIPEVEGTLAARDFLEAVQAKMAPQWAGLQLSQMLYDEVVDPSKCKTLDEISKWFKILVDQEENRAKLGLPASGVYAAYGRNPGYGDSANGGNRSASASGSTTAAGGKWSGSNGSTSSTDNKRGRNDDCPCKYRHPWSPDSCQTLRFALRGETEKRRRPGPERCAAIKAELAQDKYADLRRALVEKGWLREGDLPKKNQPGDKPATGHPRYPGTTVAAILDMRITATSKTPEGVYATSGSMSHPYASSTLLDNCGGTHLVNDRELLEPGSFKASSEDDFILCGSDQLPVLGRGRRIIRGILDGETGEGVHDLILQNVALVEDFHVNIVSEKLLRKSGIWYNGWDCTLRFGTLDKNVVVKKLKPQDNLTFLDLQTRSGVYAVPSSSAEIFAIPAVQNSGTSHPFRPSRDSLRPREDIAELWHTRVGYLG